MDTFDKDEPKKKNTFKHVTKHIKLSCGIFLLHYPFQLRTFSIYVFVWASTIEMVISSAYKGRFLFIAWYKSLSKSIRL